MKQKHVDTILRQYKKLKITERQLARIIELWQVNRDVEKKLYDMMERVKPSQKCGKLSIRCATDYDDFKDTAEWKASEEAFKDLATYIGRLPRSKQYDLDCIMNLGRNIDYYGVCDETVEDFAIRVDERRQNPVDPEYYAGKRPLGKWIKMVREVVNRPVFGTMDQFPEDKMLMITIMPPGAHPPKMVATIRWDELNDVWMRHHVDEEKGELVFEICDVEEQGTYSFWRDGMTYDIDKHPWLNTRNLYALYGWTTYMSYRMIVPITENRRFIFNLSEAKPYVVNDFIPEEEMKRLREKLTPMELRKMFCPGASEPYPI